MNPREDIMPDRVPPNRRRPLTGLAGSLPLFLVLASMACGTTSSASDGGADGGPPIVFDAGPQPDSGTSTPADGGGRATACGSYCNKLFDCGFFPRPGQPAGYGRETCRTECEGVFFPAEERRECVATGACACDAGTSCHTVDSCFSFGDGG
jgi:hypothetical protein